VYGKLPRPWNAQTSVAAPAPAALPPPPPPTPAELAAARLKIALADIEKMLAGGPTFEQLPALESRLAAARKDGGADAAAKLAARAQEALIKAAAAELDKDEIDTGVAHYRAALELDAPEKGRPALAEALRGHAMTALTDRKDPSLAVRWARECVAFDNNDATHALLADMLYAAHEFKDSVDEYRLAIAGRPDDPTLKRGLDRARRKVVPDKPARPRAKTRSASAAPDDEAPAESGDDAAKTAAPSAPAEPAAGEQQ
jgi:tetratricopeptide (TPR) repeat protein